MNRIHMDRVPRIVQGAGALDDLGALIGAVSGATSAVLLVADPGMGPAGITAQAQASLRQAGHRAVLFEDFKSDPTMAQADAGAALARREQVVAVVAVGGGSALDVGKAIAGIAPGNHGAHHYGLCAHPFPTRPLPCITVPTTSGTGSEATRTAVLTDPAGAKVWLWGDELKPVLILLDPVLTTGLPAGLTAATGVDALVHAIEASTNANAQAANNVYCHEAIRLVRRHLLRAVQVPTDVAARAGLQWAATFAGIGIDNTGTAIAHNIGHALASLRPVHHGRAVALGMRATLAWNIEDDDGRFAAAAAALSDSADVRQLPATFERLVRDAGIKVSLRGEGYDGISAAQLAAQMGRPENEAMRRSNRRPSSEAELLEFAQRVLGES